jgi:hypothetical protein
MLNGVVIDDTDLSNEKLQEWEDFHNLNRPHGGLNGQTPYERLRQKTQNPVQAITVSGTGIRAHIVMPRSDRAPTQRS